MLDAACVDDYNNAGDKGVNDDAAVDDGGKDDNSGDNLVADDQIAVAAVDNVVNDKDAGDDLDCFYACNGNDF